MARTKCKVCRKPLPEVAIAHRDPYCSMTCCRRDYGVDLAPTPSTSEQGMRQPQRTKKASAAKKKVAV